MVCSWTILHARTLTAPHCFVNRHIRPCSWLARISLTFEDAGSVLAAHQGNPSN